MCHLGTSRVDKHSWLASIQSEEEWRALRNLQTSFNEILLTFHIPPFSSTCALPSSEEKIIHAADRVLRLLVKEGYAVFHREVHPLGHMQHEDPDLCIIIKGQSTADLNRQNDVT
jgi:hypothetical protein